MIRNPKDLERHTASERVNHWIVAICFVLIALSGLAFFHPFFWPLTQLFGGGPWTRIVHPYIALLLVIFFISMFVRFRGLNAITPADWEWLKRVREVAGGDDSAMPPQGKFNGGQKVMFWSITICLLLMVLTGLVMWRAYFTFPVTLVRLAAVVHAAVGALAIIIIMGHIYLAIWTRGTISAMVYGTVSAAWARQHHETWYHQMRGKVQS
jgi:formate dehydrogenase subunit gamma